MSSPSRAAAPPPPDYSDDMKPDTRSFYADAVQRTIRTSDSAARYGGDAAVFKSSQGKQAILIGQDPFGEAYDTAILLYNAVVTGVNPDFHQPVKQNHFRPVGNRARGLPRIDPQQSATKFPGNDPHEPQSFL